MSPSDQLAQNILDFGHNIQVLAWIAIAMFIVGLIVWGIWAGIKYLGRLDEAIANKYPHSGLWFTVIILIASMLMWMIPQEWWR